MIIFEYNIWILKLNKVFKHVIQNKLCSHTKICLWGCLGGQDLTTLESQTYNVKPHMLVKHHTLFSGTYLDSNTCSYNKICLYRSICLYRDMCLYTLYMLVLGRDTWFLWIVGGFMRCWILRYLRLVMTSKFVYICCLSYVWFSMLFIILLLSGSSVLVARFISML